MTCLIVVAALIACFAMWLEHVIRQDQCHQPPLEWDE